MPIEQLIYEPGAIARIIFNNPARHNAMSLAMWEAADEAVGEATADPATRVLILTGAGGKAFVSGADISKFESERATEEAVRVYNETADRMYGRLHDFPKPTIAAIQGYCIGGGLALASACDVRIATAGSRFAIPAAKLGLGYGYKGIRRLVELIGPSFTKELFFTARQFSASDAIVMGLVNRVVPDAEFAGYVADYAQTIADNAPLTVAQVKQTVNEALKDPAERDLAASERLIAACFASADYKEGRAAFLEKRKPMFRGGHRQAASR